jgi:hypothetical protein
MKNMKQISGVSQKQQLEGMTQLELINGIRRSIHLPTRVIRPDKGAGYRRPQGNWSKWND